MKKVIVRNKHIGHDEATGTHTYEHPLDIQTGNTVSVEAGTWDILTEIKVPNVYERAMTRLRSLIVAMLRSLKELMWK
jgi:hypothetical protein